MKRLAALLAVVGLAGGLTAGAQARAPEERQLIARQRLPVPAAADVPVCPGPETLQAPEGSVPVPVPGPVAIAGLAVMASAVVSAASVPTTAGAGQPPAPPAPSAALRPMTASASAPRAPGSSPTGVQPTGVQPTGTQPTGTQPTGSSASAAFPGAAVLTASPTDAGPWRLDTARYDAVPAVAAAQWTLARTGDLRGLTSTGCAVAGTDLWLVGGGTQIGRRGRLILANPGASPAVVDVTVLGPDGAVPASAGEGVTVPAGEQKALFVDALAPGISSLAVHVQARNGRVAATLHDSLIRGLVPGGSDDVPPAAPPAHRQVVPGVAVRAAVPAPGAAASPLPTDPTRPGAVAVRVAVPGDSPAVVRVHLLGPDGEVNLPGGGVATVPGLGVADLPISGVPDGLYAAIVEADSPVVAGAVIGRSVTGSEAAGTPADVLGKAPPSELAWAAAARPVSALTAITLPAATGTAGDSTAGTGVWPAQNAGTVLTLAPGTATAGKVLLAAVARDGTVSPSRELDVPADGILSLDVEPATAGLVLRPVAGAGPVVAAVVLQVDDPAGPLISVQTVRPGSGATGAAPRAGQDQRLGLPAAADPAGQG